MAVSKRLYLNLVFTLAFAVAATAFHMVYHSLDYVGINDTQQLPIHLAIDVSLILVAISMFTTFRQIYGLLQGGTVGKKVEENLRSAVNEILEK